MSSSKRRPIDTSFLSDHMAGKHRKDHTVSSFNDLNPGSSRSYKPIFAFARRASDKDGEKEVNTESRRVHIKEESESDQEEVPRMVHKQKQTRAPIITIAGEEDLGSDEEDNMPVNHPFTKNMSSSQARGRTSHGVIMTPNVKTPSTVADAEKGLLTKDTANRLYILGKELTEAQNRCIKDAIDVKEQLAQLMMIEFRNGLGLEPNTQSAILYKTLGTMLKRQTTTDAIMMRMVDVLRDLSTELGTRAGHNVDDAGDQYEHKKDIGETEEGARGGSWFTGWLPGGRSKGD